MKIENIHKAVGSGTVGDVVGNEGEGDGDAKKNAPCVHRALTSK